MFEKLWTIFNKKNYLLEESLSNFGVLIIKFGILKKIKRKSNYGKKGYQNL